jgi:hypothetical protein
MKDGCSKTGLEREFRAPIEQKTGNDGQYSPINVQIKGMQR